MAVNIYYDKDCDLSLIKGMKVAILGYGSQGHAHANNLKDSGVDVTVALRPEDVALSRATGASGEAQRTSVRNHWQGVVAAVTPSGPLVRVSVRLADGGGNETCFGGEGELVALVTRASAEELEIAPGVEVTASVKATALHVLGVSQQKGRLA